MLKSSHYNIEITKDNNNESVIFNSFTGAMAIIDSKTYEYINNNDFIDISDVPEEIKDNIILMETHGYLVDKDIDEKERLNILSNIARFGQKTLVLTIAPTMDCNMSCPYCYEDHQQSKMSQKTALKLVEFTKKHLITNRFNSLYIGWYGGEPLLEIKTISKISRKLIEFCNDNNIRFNSSIITNGLLLTKDIAKLLKNDCKIGACQITVDGPKDINNKRRISKDGKDSFTQIINNIDDCKEDMFISIRVNVDRYNNESMYELIDFFKSKNDWNERVNYYFAPVENLTEACTYNKKSCFSHSEFADINANLLRYQYSLSKNMEIPRPKPKHLPCEHISPNVFVVDPKGYLYKCWNNVGIVSLNVGHVDSGPIFNKEHMKWLSYKIPNECEECNKRPLCQGGCPYAVMQNDCKLECHHFSMGFETNLELLKDQFLTNELRNHEKEVK
ncbi:radical SAM/SPASM domain-containing protein [Paramaledivibacter caminithermalis]|jgi:uncharacterized protein|uniref:Radical SAM core domain-containing protein n=1 Tax=Paramaledivibacter caminithermalis (strain DSM 15212 / CIP 107654 / DViRD3) TaxID=1121301 RepID=A0A1M6TMG2_PARC5|nr:radical SAM protein [Paramaledivibacter caminithermalis]SHK57978.1 uncharacterized protein SAMN02745912_03730 [Paramaledivibacter caminithermalis DSM 15212]